MRIFKFPKSRRILRSVDFQKIRENGEFVQNRYFKLAFKKNENSDSATRLGIIVTKKFGCSVKRSRAKRLIRESFRLVAPSVMNGYDLALIVRQGAEKLNLIDFDNNFKDLLKETGLLPKNYLDV